MPSTTGGLLSFIIIYVTIMFGTLRFKHMIEKHNPTINAHIDYDSFHSNDHYAANQKNNFNLAFSLEHFFEQRTLNDTSKIKFFAYLLKADHSKRSSVELPIY